MVVVDLVRRARAEDLEHLRDDDVAARVGVLAGEVHRRDVVLAERRVGVQQHRRRVHLAVRAAVGEAAAGGEREEARRGLVAEPARAEVHADPDEAVVAREQVDVVVARADRAELVARHLHESALRAEVGLEDRVEHRVVDRLGVVASHAEGDAREDVVHDARQVGAHVVDADVGADGLVAAADVVADAARRDVVRVGEHAADRLRVADVAVGADRGGDGVAGLGAAAQLLDGARLDVALHGDRDLAHAAHRDARRRAAASRIRTARLWVRTHAHARRRMRRRSGLARIAPRALP